MRGLMIRSLFLLILLGPCLGAQTVSVLALQDDDSAEPAPRPYLIDIGSGAMDALFFSGMIATSQPPAVMRPEGIEAFLPEICARAQEEYVAWLIMIFIRDGEFSVDGRKVHQPALVEYLAVDCADARIALRGRFEGPPGALAPDDLRQWCLQAGARIEADCLSVLKGKEEGK